MWNRRSRTIVQIRLRCVGMTIELMIVVLTFSIEYPTNGLGLVPPTQKPILIWPEGQICKLGLYPFNLMR